MLFQITHICFNEPDYVTLDSVITYWQKMVPKLEKM